jgi:hypothetical protein
MFRKKKLKIAKELASIVYLVESNPALELRKEAQEIFNHVYEVVDSIGGMKLFLAVQLFLTDFRKRGRDT